MKNGDIQFHDVSSRILDCISDEGLRIAKENKWRGVGIRVAHTSQRIPGTPRALRCHLVKTGGESEIDEPTAALLDASNELFDLFEEVGTPLASMTMDWVKEGAEKNAHRRTRYTYPR